MPRHIIGNDPLFVDVALTDLLLHFIYDRKPAPVPKPSRTHPKILVWARPHAPNSQPLPVSDFYTRLGIHYPSVEQSLYEGFFPCYLTFPRGDAPPLMGASLELRHG